MNLARLTLSGGGLTLPLDDNLNPSPLGGAAVLDDDLDGLDLPPVTLRLFDGAGDGSTYRGARVQPRPFTLTVMLTAVDRPSLRARASVLAQILDPLNAPARLTYTEPDGTDWQTDVVRSGSKRITTDGETHLILRLDLTAPDPFWTREEAAETVIQAAGQGRGLLRPGGSLSKLRLASGQILGAVTIENPGDALAYPVTTLLGPATSLTLISPAGETLPWAGTLAVGERRVFDHAAATVVDGSGVKRYSELGTAPRFWAVRPGLQTAQVNATGTDTTNSAVVMAWRPRRWIQL